MSNKHNSYNPYNPYNYEKLKYQSRDYENYFIDDLYKIEKTNKTIDKEPETNKIIGKNYYETYYLNKEFYNHREMKEQ